MLAWVEGPEPSTTSAISVPWMPVMETVSAEPLSPKYAPSNMSPRIPALIASMQPFVLSPGSIGLDRSSRIAPATSADPLIVSTGASKSTVTQFGSTPTVQPDTPSARLSLSSPSTPLAMSRAVSHSSSVKCATEKPPPVSEPERIQFLPCSLAPDPSLAPFHQEIELAPPPAKV